MSKMKSMFEQLIANIVFGIKKCIGACSQILSFRRHSGKKIIVVLAGIASVSLIVMLLISGQQNIGAREAGGQIDLLAQNIRKHYQIRPDFWGLNTLEVIKKNIYPSTMRINENILYGYFGNEVIIGADINGNPVMPSMKNFVIAYKDLSKLQCIGLATNSFNPEFWLGIREISIIHEDKTNNFSWGNTDYTLPLKKNLAAKICGKSNNTLVFKFE